MSRSSRSRRLTFRGMENNPEAVISTIKSFLAEVQDMLSDEPAEWEEYLRAARSAIASIDHINFLSMTERVEEQTWIIEVLQDYAYHDSDRGSIQEIATWCQASWLRILHAHPEDVGALTGLGHNWLQRSQATLARIHRDEGSGSSSGSSQGLGSGAAQRAQTALFVEARGYLQPAVDFFSRAISAAEQSGTLTGDLLSSAAEACMSLGNVSPVQTAEQHFTQAIQYLRRAQAISGYNLSVYLRQYLDNYGRYVT